MKITNSQNTSFKARFVMNVEPKVWNNTPADKFEKSVDFAPKKSNNFLKFLGFIQSKEGSEILNKLPKNDIIRLESPFLINDENGRVTIEPYFIYEASGLTKEQNIKLAFSLPNMEAQGKFLDPSRNMAPQFKKWISSLAKVRQEVETNS